jgi:WD40 repeat protein
MRLLSTALLAIFSVARVCSAEAPITAIAFAPNGESLVVASAAKVKLLSWPSLQSIRKLSVSMTHVHDIVTTDDSVIVVGGVPAQHGVVEVFAWSGERTASSQRHEDVIHAADWNPVSGELATAGRDSQVILAGIEMDAPRRVLTGHSRGVLAVQYLPTTRLIVTAGLDHTLRVWNADTSELELIRNNHRGVVRDLAVRPQQNGLAVLASAGADRTVRFWQPTIGRFMRYASLPVEPLAIAWTHDATSLVASCTDGAIRVIDPQEVMVVETITVGEGWLYAVDAAPNEYAVAVGDGQGRVQRVLLGR